MTEKQLLSEKDCVANQDERFFEDHLQDVWKKEERIFLKYGKSVDNLTNEEIAFDLKEELAKIHNGLEPLLKKYNLK